MATEKKQAQAMESKTTFTLVVEFDNVSENAMEGIRAIVDEARSWGKPVKAELSGLPPKISFL